MTPFAFRRAIVALQIPVAYFAHLCGGVSRQAVYGWMERGTVPPHAEALVADLLSLQVKYEKLRPFAAGAKA